jgi:hypothetical protein
MQELKVEKHHITELDMPDEPVGKLSDYPVLERIYRRAITDRQDCVNCVQKCCDSSDCDVWELVYT